MDVEVAAECGVPDRTLYNWKKREGFIARVNAVVQAYSARVLGSGIANRVRRLEILGVAKIGEATSSDSDGGT